MFRLGEPIERGTAFGRLAFAIASIDLPSLEKRMKDKNLTILTPLITLETPGKATVTVIILADPVSIITIFRTVIVLML